MKKFIIIILSITLLLTLTGCTKEKEITDALKFKEEYESINNQDNGYNGKKHREITIDEDNPFIYTTAEELSEKMNNKESFIVYFGFKDCPWCRSVIEQLVKVAKDNDVDKIYYVDVKEIRDTIGVDEEGNLNTTKEGSKGYKELIEKMRDVLDDYKVKNSDGEEIETGEKRIYAPNVVAVSKGEAIQLETGISKEQKDGYQELTDKMKKETYNSFKCLITCLEEASTTCQKDMC